MPNKDLTEIICIMDRSGSMESIKGDAIGGFNSFVGEQKKLPGEAKLTLALFDHEYDLVHNGFKLEDIDELTEETYSPRGLTALLDAVGRTISDVEERHKYAQDRDIPEKVLVAIITDGVENASKDYTRDKVFEIIDEKKKAGWEFIFLAAGQDAIATGGNLGIDMSRCATFTADSADTTRAYHTMSLCSASFRAGNSDFSAQDFHNNHS